MKYFVVISQTISWVSQKRLSSWGGNLPIYWYISHHLVVVLTYRVRCVTQHSSPSRGHWLHRPFFDNFTRIIYIQRFTIWGWEGPWEQEWPFQNGSCGIGGFLLSQTSNYKNHFWGWSSAILDSVIEHFNQWAPMPNQCFRILVIRLAMNVRYSQFGEYLVVLPALVAPHLWPFLSVWRPKGRVPHA